MLFVGRIGWLDSVLAAVSEVVVEVDLPVQARVGAEKPATVAVEALAWAAVVAAEVVVVEAWVREVTVQGAPQPRVGVRRVPPAACPVAEPAAWVAAAA